MGIIANIYRSNMGDCSNLGLSSNCTEVTVVNVKGPFEPSKDRPAVELVKGYVEGSCLVRPVSLRGEHLWAVPLSLLLIVDLVPRYVRLLAVRLRPVMGRFLSTIG